MLHSSNKRSTRLLARTDMFLTAWTVLARSSTSYSVLPARRNAPPNNMVEQPGQSRHPLTDNVRARGEHHEIDGPYVIVQRDFEMPDDGRSSASLQSP
jgi:hypothetical protein